MITVESTVEGPAAAANRGRLLALAGREARRLARHPAFWLPQVVAVGGMVNLALTTRFSAGSQYPTIFLAVAALGPITAIFAAHLVASSSRRSRVEEMLSVTPMPGTERTLATCLGVAFTLGAFGAVGAAIMTVVAAGAPAGEIGLTELQSPGELAQIPPIVAGGGLLGVLTARWLRFPGGALATFVIFVVGGALVYDGIEVTDPARLWFPWSTTPPILYEGVEPAGDHVLHAAYLVGLCACATIAAVYRDRPQWAKLAAFGVPAAAGTALLGFLQLP